MSETRFPQGPLGSAHDGDRADRDGRRRRVGRLVGAAAALTALALVAAACTSKSAPAGHTAAPSAPPTSASSSGVAGPGVSSAAPPPSTTPPPPPVQLVASPGRHNHLSPLTPIQLTAKNGTLASVQLISSDGKKVRGTLSADKTSWQSSEVLGYDKTYRLVAKAVGTPTADPASTKMLHTRFTTLNPPNMTMPYFQYMGGYALQNGATYGVGIVPVVHFDEPITDKAAAERMLSVTTTPHVAGSWYWDPDTSQDAMFRPRHFWPSGTKVTISVNDYGKRVSPGLYGQADASTSFTIGRKQITLADDNAPRVDKVRVYKNGKLVRTMNTSMGEHSGETVNGNFIDFHTMNGTYTVLEHDNPAIMSSASYGLPANAPGGYAPEPIYYSTKISTDGVYLHELDTTVWAQDSGVDVSHGCLNLDQANAIWFYDHSMIGDPVVVRHTGGPTIQLWEGGAWSIPWKQWLAGSALA